MSKVREMPKPKQDRLSAEAEAMQRIAQRAELDENAKLAYSIWQNRTNDYSRAWEQLPPDHMDAWRDIVDWVDDELSGAEPVCVACGKPLECENQDCHLGPPPRSNKQKQNTAPPQGA